MAEEIVRLVAERDEANVQWHKIRDLHASAITDLRATEARVTELEAALRTARVNIVAVNAAGFDSSRGRAALDALESIDAALAAPTKEEDDPFCPHGIPHEFCGNCHEEETVGDLSVIRERALRCSGYGGQEIADVALDVLKLLTALDALVTGGRRFVRVNDDGSSDEMIEVHVPLGVARAALAPKDNA